MSTSESQQRTEIGRGRSGVVFSNGTKIFSAKDSLAKLVNYIFLGAPNPYTWNKDAIMCAHLERNIHSTLFPYMLGKKAKMSNSHGTFWDDELMAYGLKVEIINGRHVSLHHPFSEERESELGDLVEKIMRPLQKELYNAGFDGLMWQAGFGTPNALSNFMLEENDGPKQTFAWIDAESAVPALFPLNISKLFSFYLPVSFRNRRPLFDDVDTNKLESYLSRHADNLEKKLGSERFDDLIVNLELLADHQEKWKSMRRVDRSITYSLKKEKITENEASYYSKHLILWYRRQASKALKKLPMKLYRLSYDAISKIILNGWKVIKHAPKFVVNKEYRSEVIRDYVDERISAWEKRKQLTSVQGDYLREQLKEEQTSAYLSDFFFLMMVVKPVEKAFELGVLPVLYATGVIDAQTLFWSELLLGSIDRSIYTGIKQTQDLFKPKEQRRPRGLALLVGFVPTGGNFAYPLQTIYADTSKRTELAEFIIYDTFTRVGANIPIWGGKDTRTEHFFNHIPDLIIRKRKDLSGSIKSSDLLQDKIYL
ncbi:hypothetical protein HQ533_04350 [Candidatus Woesearchaeota archaeon]|nr:hypothetical protein [Candidatus Woesearchaeota archaeon]